MRVIDLEMLPPIGVTGGEAERPPFKERGTTSLRYASASSSFILASAFVVTIAIARRQLD
uniref:Uncharacterized protein n=1 Tax=Oryza rufipogon TaxID=4529 RepID=A0A0E0Q402_ORYRU